MGKKPVLTLWSLVLMEKPENGELSPKEVAAALHATKGSSAAKYGFLFSGPLSKQEVFAMPGLDFHELRASVSIADVLHLIGFVPRQTCGHQVRGPCPVHGSSSPNSRIFSVNLMTNAYRCFKCGSAGNQLDLYAALTKLSLFEAAIDLCEKLNRPTPWIYRW
jgi:hypothetical protein